MTRDCQTCKYNGTDDNKCYWCFRHDTELHQRYSKWQPKEDVTDTNVGDMISRQAAIDALHTHLMYRMGTDSNKKRLDEWINNLPSVQPKQTNCEYCHTDRDGYVFPLEKNSHAFIDRDKIVLKANGWRGEAKIKYCPICGRRLTDG